MAVPLAAAANIVGKALDMAKTSSESSAENKTDVKKYQETPMEIQKTEGDLGYDDIKPEQKEVPEQTVDNDGENPLPSEVADVEQSERPKLPEDETTAKMFGLPDDFFTNFSKEGETASESSPLSLGSILETGKNFGANPVEYGNSGSDSVFSGGSPIQGTASIGSSDDGASANPVVASQQVVAEEPKEEKESLLDMAKEAYESGKDIDDKELPYVESEQAAEDVEDLVQDESLSDEEKEKKLEEAVENEKDGQLDEGDLNEEKENPVDKAKGLVDKILPYLKHDSSSSASSSTGGGSVAEDAMNISSGGLGSVSEAINDIIGKSGGAPSETSGIADVTQSDPTNGFGERVGSHNIGGAESVKGASKAMGGKLGNELESNVSGGSSSSAGGSVAKQFNDIINGKGIDYKAPSDGGSVYENAFDKGSVGSVKVEDALKDGRILYNGSSNIGSGGSAPASAFNMVRKEIHDEYKDWKKRDGIYYKDKGSVAIYTTDGNDIKVKLGTRRLVDLEAVPTKALGIVEEIL